MTTKEISPVEITTAKMPLSQESRAVFGFAKKEAERHGYASLGRKLLLLGLIIQRDVNGVFEQFSFAPTQLVRESLERELKENFSKEGIPSAKISLTKTVKNKILPFAQEEARKDGKAETSPAHLLIGILLAEEEERRNGNHASPNSACIKLGHNGLSIANFDEIREFLKAKNSR